MSRLKELKSMFIEDANQIDDSELSVLDIANMYSKNTSNKDDIIAYLIVYTWPALEKLFYNQNNKVLSVEDCYDIFLDSLYYVLEKKVWNDKNSKLYNDKDALLKAMYTVVESRRINYFVAQNRDKRLANFEAISIDYLAQEYNLDSLLPSTSLIYSSIYKEDLIDIFKQAWVKKKYVWAVIFDIILNMDVIEKDSLNTKKIKKYIKNIDENYLINLKERYELNDSDIENSYDYLSNIEDSYIDAYIKNALQELRTHEKIKEIISKE